MPLHSFHYDPLLIWFSSIGPKREDWGLHINRLESEATLQIMPFKDPNTAVLASSGNEKADQLAIYEIRWNRNLPATE